MISRNRVRGQRCLNYRERRERRENIPAFTPPQTRHPGDLSAVALAKAEGRDPFPRTRCGKNINHGDHGDHGVSFAVCAVSAVVKFSNRCVSHECYDILQQSVASVAPWRLKINCPDFYDQILMRHIFLSFCLLICLLPLQAYASICFEKKIDWKDDVIFFGKPASMQTVQNADKQVQVIEYKILIGFKGLEWFQKKAEIVGYSKSVQLPEKERRTELISASWKNGLLYPNFGPCEPPGFPMNLKRFYYRYANTEGLDRQRANFYLIAGSFVAIGFLTLVTLVLINMVKLNKKYSLKKKP